MDVSNEYVGRIIGKGGAKIKEIQELCGCRVKIMKEEASDDTTPVELEGNCESIGAARQMISELMQMQFRN
jgi:rRNA processing protein Krr1/Pno1